MVPLAGIEPALLAESDFESDASTNSAIGAYRPKAGTAADYTVRGCVVNCKASCPALQEARTTGRAIRSDGSAGPRVEPFRCTGTSMLRLPANRSLPPAATRHARRGLAAVPVLEGFVSRPRPNIAAASASSRHRKDRRPSFHLIHDLAQRRPVCRPPHVSRSQ